jgi:7-keto-8-aminopelargonate synthetase-like enzyme
MALCRRHDALLVVDEAHAVLQPVPSLASDGPVVLQVGTLSKTLGSLGGFLAGPVGLVELVVNRARTGIFTTALSPADAAAALAAVGVLTSAEGEGLRTRLQRHVQQLRPGHETPVLAVVLGEEARAMAASAELLAQGLLVPAIRPPTVAPGTSRLRVALSAAHTDDEVEQLAAALARLDAPVGGHL